LAVGEALVSMLDDGGSPLPVERAKIVPPESRLGAITPEERQQVVRSSSLFGKYEKAVDKQSAFEMLRQREEAKREVEPPTTKGARRSTRRGPLESVFVSTMREVSQQVVRAIFRSFGGRSRRR
jgi:hypothetical protein